MILCCGTGEPWQELWPRTIGGTTDIAADTQPVPFKQGHVRVWLRGSSAALPLGANITADWLKAPGCLRAYDEVVVNSLSPSDVFWLESVLPAVGSNDGNGPASQVLVFLAGNPWGSYVERVLAAAAGNPKVLLGVEGYHQGAVYASMLDLRAEERAWKDRLVSRNQMGQAVYGFSVADAPWYAGQNPAYCSSSALARDADEDAITEWLQAGCQHVFAWGLAYSTERSRWMGADAVYRGLRRRYGVSP